MLDLRSYHSVHALCTERKGELKATHIAICQIGGPAPIWGVYTIAGRFLRFFDRKQAVAEAYPQLVWRRWMVSWRVNDLEPLTIEQRRTALAEMQAAQDGKGVRPLFPLAGKR